MDKDALTAVLTRIVGEYLTTQDMELVDIICRHEGRDLVVRILADRLQGGITLDDCAYLNREIGLIVDAQNVFEEGYILEVSSPGLDRPLKTKNDFLRSMHKRVKIFLNDLVNGKLEWDGDITGASDTSVYIETQGGNVEIPLEKIVKGKQVIL